VIGESSSWTPCTVMPFFPRYRPKVYVPPIDTGEATAVSL